MVNVMLLLTIHIKSNKFGCDILLLKSIFHKIFIMIFFKINLFIYLFLAALGFCCCTRAFSSCGERGLLFVAVRGLLMAVASLAVEHRL